MLLEKARQGRWNVEPSFFSPLDRKREIIRQSSPSRKRAQEARCTERNRDFDQKDRHRESRASGKQESSFARQVQRDGREKAQPITAAAAGRPSPSSIIPTRIRPPLLFSSSRGDLRIRPDTTQFPLSARERRESMHAKRASDASEMRRRRRARGVDRR